MKVADTDSFIKKSKLIHGDKYDYSLVDYKRSFIKVEIICKDHGVFNITPSNHLNGKKCKKCFFKKLSDRYKKNTFDFIKKANVIHNNTFDYSETKYDGLYKEVIIICKIHGKFTQKPSSHLAGSNGCDYCVKRKKYTNSEIISKFINIHGNEFDYSKVNYKSLNEKVIIICRLHGEFKQTPTSHLNGSKCKVCFNCKIKKILSENPNGWSVKHWYESSLKSKRFDSFKVYIIKCWNNEEEFYKIGRTYTSIKYRFRSLKYNYEIIKEFIFDNAKEAYDKEIELKRINIKNKYIPSIFFNGYKECFLKINLH